MACGGIPPCWSTPQSSNLKAPDGWPFPSWMSSEELQKRTSDPEWGLTFKALLEAMSDRLLELSSGNIVS